MVLIGDDFEILEDYYYYCYYYCRTVDYEMVVDDDDIFEKNFDSWMMIFDYQYFYYH
jgi:hypothetical protein